MRTTSAGVSKATAGALHALAGFNLVVFIIMTAIAAHLYDGVVTNKLQALRVFGRATNAQYTLLVSLVSGCIGIATTVFGLLHVRAWSETSRGITLGVNMISLALCVLAAGSAGRSDRTGQANGPTGWFDQLKVMYALDYCLMILQLIYVVFLAMTARHSEVANRHTVGTHPGVVNNHHDKNAAVNGTHRVDTAAIA